MAITNIYSKRLLREQERDCDVYSYDSIPNPLRVQLMQIINDGMGVPKHDPRSYKKSRETYAVIHRNLCREYGVDSLPVGNARLNPNAVDADRLKVFALTVSEYLKVLDLVELFLNLIETLHEKHEYTSLIDISVPFEDVKHEVNERFKEHGVGYRYESGEIIRIDSQFIHAEAVKPALGMLSAPMYAGANEEFLKSHEHYRHGNYKECLNECLKSFESTMKSICDKHQWAYASGSTAKSLIEICFASDLIPQSLQSQFGSLRAGLESGIPTVRNKMGGHGQGAQPTSVPDYLAGYLLHLTATTILLLAKAEESLP